MRGRDAIFNLLDSFSLSSLLEEEVSLLSSRSRLVTRRLIKGLLHDRPRCLLLVFVPLALAFSSSSSSFSFLSFLSLEEFEGRFEGRWESSIEK